MNLSGIPAEDYDIQDNFGQTDHVVDPKIYAAIMEKHGLKEMLEKVGIEQKDQLSLF